MNSTPGLTLRRCFTPAVCHTPRGSNASGFAAVAFSAPPADSTPAVPSAMAGAALTTRTPPPMYVHVIHNRAGKPESVRGNRCVGQCRPCSPSFLPVSSMHIGWLQAFKAEVGGMSFRGILLSTYGSPFTLLLNYPPVPQTSLLATFRTSSALRTTQDDADAFLAETGTRPRSTRACNANG